MMYIYHITEFSSLAQSCPTLCDSMNLSMLGLPVHHHLPEFTQTHVHRVSDPIQPSHPLSSPSPPAPNPFQYQSLFQWVNSSHQVAKVLEWGAIAFSASAYLRLLIFLPAILIPACVSSSYCIHKHFSALSHLTLLMAPCYRHNYDLPSFKEFWVCRILTLCV